MTYRFLAALTFTFTLTPIAAFAVPPTNAQKCTSDVEKASGTFAQCKLNAESVFAKSGDAGKLSVVLGRCLFKYDTTFGRATARYGAACPMTESSAGFDAYLSQCSTNTAAAAGGAALPDYVGELASCNADLSTCNGDLSTCDVDLSTCNADLTTAQSALATCQGNLATCQATPPGRLLKTGQTTCWDTSGTVIACIGTGQDGESRTGLAPGYVDNGDGTITDTNTGLMWEKLSDDGSIHDKDDQYNWNSVGLKIGALNSAGGFAGHTDWRLPNRRELDSIVNLENVSPAVSPAFNTNCGTSSNGNVGCTVTTCSCSVMSTYWTSSTHAFSKNLAWSINFNDGGDYWDPKSFDRFVRAVRGGS